MNISDIGYALDQVAKNVSALMNHADALPDESTVTTIVGGNNVTSEKNITDQLQWATTVLSSRIDRLRTFVRVNADALQVAAGSLQQNETDNTLSASAASAFINKTVESAPVSAPSPHSNASATSTSRRAF